MKTLKSKLFAGIFSLASLGFLGDKNLAAQNVNQGNVKIDFEYVSKDRNQISCFNESHKTGDYYKVKLSCEKGHYHIAHFTEFLDQGLTIVSSKRISIVNFNGKCLQHPEKEIYEEFVIDYNSGLINYRMFIESLDTSKMAAVNRETIYSEKNLTKDEIYKKFGEDFVKRTKEMINAHEQKDSLTLVNLIKKEYQEWKIVEDENGEKFELKIPAWVKLK